MQKVGPKIRILRHQKGWKQEDMAKNLGMSTTAYSKIETGVTTVTMSRLEQIATLFGMSLVQLMTCNEIDMQVTTPPNHKDMMRKIHEREADIIGLQNKVIELYGELRHLKM